MRSLQAFKTFTEKSSHLLQSPRSKPAKLLDIVIVVDQLLTGFDSQYVNVLYLDKVLENDNLIQAISRTNRVYDNNEKPDYEEEKRQREMYWATVRYAKSQLYDYYGTGAHFCPGMYTMIGNIKNWSPDQIINEAHKNGLI